MDRDEMDKAAFDAMMEESLAQAKTGQGVSVEEAFRMLRGSLCVDIDRDALTGQLPGEAFMAVLKLDEE